jgi:hypothetical protein
MKHTLLAVLLTAAIVPAAANAAPTYTPEGIARAVASQRQRSGLRLFSGGIQQDQISKLNGATT